MQSKPRSTGVKKPRRANVEALYNVVPFPVRKDDMSNRTAAASNTQEVESLKEELAEAVAMLNHQIRRNGDLRRELETVRYENTVLTRRVAA